MKKILSLIIIFVMLVPTFCVPSVAHAETLGDLKSKLNKKQEEYNQNEKQKQLTQQEINKTNNEIATIKKNISQTYVDIEVLEKDISALYDNISSKKAEVKKIINFVQISSGVSSYLEYIFGAESFTDLIYRAAVAEQMSAYNEKLVDEYNSLIDQSRKKQEEIQKKQTELTGYQQQLEEKSAALGQELEKHTATSLDIQEEIKAQKEIIETYKNKGCYDNETISACLKRTSSSGKGILPVGTAFYRPLMRGHVTSEWGTRYYGGQSFHEGIDMGTPEGTVAYSIGTGVVATIRVPKYSGRDYRNCGGKMVVVHHDINGRQYTSVYAHLLSYNVSVGDVVNKNTIIGYTGGLTTQSYDPCTSGAHLHLTVARGLYGIDYNDWNQLNYTYSINPRTVINYPSGGNYWNDRVTAY